MRAALGKTKNTLEVRIPMALEVSKGLHLLEAPDLGSRSFDWGLDIHDVQINSIPMNRVIRQWIGQQAGLWARLRQLVGQRQPARRPVAVQLEFWAMTKR